MKEIRKWLERQLSEADFSVNEISLGDSASWKYENGLLRHKSGLFFQIIGLQWNELGGACLEQPFINQREIGTLAFFVRSNNGRKQLLVQGKIEPGNIGVIQLAPSYQATKSNSSRVHGGAFPPLTELMNSDKMAILYDKQQSEQGTRFLYKRNRNAIGLVNEDFSVPQSHMWVDSETIFDMMNQDYLVNTDARSVLICSPWQLLTERLPFSRYSDGIGRDLMNSLNVFPETVSKRGLTE